jgi:release factor glutamine methyltransferase
MMATLGSLIGEAAAALSEAGFEEPRRLARRLTGSAFAVSAARLLAESDREVDSKDAQRLHEFLRRMVQHEPLSRIFGHREFWGLDFALSPDTLDPRPETETLVASVLARIEDRGAPLTILDLGVGTGCVLLALLTELSAATGIGVDICAGAARTARANAAALGLAARADFIVGDWLAALDARFSVIVANPPYIATGMLGGLPRAVRDYDPVLALDGGGDGLAAYRAIAAGLAARLAPAGIFAVEIGAGQRGDVQAILAEAGLAVDGVESDLGGISRCVIASSASDVGRARRNKGVC